MSVSARRPYQPRSRVSRLAQHARVLQVVAGSEFKLKYAGSALGYVWSVIKPLGLFLMLYLVFGRLFDLRAVSPYYPVSLLIGIVLHLFFADATSLSMTSLVARESLLRKLSFPRLVIPTSATVTAALTFVVNLTVIGGFVAWNGIVPRLDWILVIPLLLELYVFVLGVSYLLSALFVRFRDISQIWELVLQLLFYAMPIIYPVGFLPPGLRTLVFVNPFTQVLQDVRALILYPDLEPNKITADEVFGFTGGRLIPIGVAIGMFLFGLWVFKRDEPWYAERV